MCSSCEPGLDRAKTGAFQQGVLVDSGSQKRRPCTGRVFNQSETVWNTPNADVLVLARMLGKEVKARWERLDGVLAGFLAQALDEAIGDPS